VIGFLVTGALVGLGALGWPLYLHLFRQRKPRIVTVPSLVLFSLERRRNRRRRISDLLLLLSRLLIFLALCLLLARPYVRTRWQLPLPTLSRDRRVLAVVVDTSLRAMGHDGEHSRFEYERDWLVEHLRDLPPEIAVAVASTAQPMAAPLLSAPEAIRLIESMRPVPVPGSAGEAVRVLQEQTAGIPSLLCVLASRDMDLWADEEQEASFLLHDTTDIAPPRGIRRIERDVGDPRGLDCQLFGFASDEAELPLLLLVRSDGRETGRQVTAQEMLQGRLRIELPDLGDERFVAIAVAGGKSPWDCWHLGSQAAVQTGGDRCWLVVDDSPDSQTSKALVVAALQAVCPALRLRVIPESSLRDVVGDRPPTQLVLVALASPSADTGALVRRVLGRGGRVSAFCPPTGGDLPGFLTWGEVVSNPDRGLLPAEKAEDWLPVDSLALSGLGGVAVPRSRAPRLGEGSVPLIVGEDGPVVQGLARGDGRLLAVGIPLDRASDSPVFHPVFPHLVAGVVCRGEARQGELGHTVGESPRVADLFGLKEYHGDVVAPDGKRHPVAQASDRVFLGQAGIWRLAGGDGGTSVAVNTARPSAVAAPTREEWLARHRQFTVSWTDEDTNLAARSLYVRSGRRERAYDASSVMAVLLLIGLFGEAVLRVLAVRNARRTTHA
jgi:hypothetical protein